jgi:hypothetical protein
MKPGYWEWPSDKKLKEMESRAGTLAEVVQRDQCELFEEGALDIRTFNRLLLESEVASSCCYLVKLIRRRAGGR